MSEVLTPVVTEAPTERELTFDAEFSQPTEKFHGSVEVPGARDPVPYTVEVPYDLTSDSLAVLSPGLGAIKRHSRNLRHALAAEQGVMALSFDPARRRSRDSSRTERLLNPQKLHEDTLVSILTDVGHNIEFYRSERGEAVRSAKWVFVPHSMGELPAVSFIAKNLASAHGLVRIETVGTEGRLGLKLVPRTVEEVAFDIAPAVAGGHFGFSPVLALRELKYFGSDLLRTSGEVVSCMTADTTPFTEAFHDAGIYQAYVGGSRDRYFRPNDTIKAVGHLLNYAEVLDIGHVGPQKEPSVVAASVGRILIERPGA